MKLTLYHCNTSHASQKLRLYLQEYGIEYQEKHIDLRNQEHITSNYREVNPLGTVPAIVYDGDVVCGSSEAMFYVLNAYCLPGYKDEALNQKLDELCRVYEALHDPHLRTLSYHQLFMNQKKFSTEERERIKQLAEQHPWPERGEFLLRAANGDFTEEELALANMTIKQAMDNVECLLAATQSAFILNTDFYTIADAVVTATLFRLEKLGLLASLCGDVTRKYYRDIQQRQNFSRAGML